ncbi:MAG: helix-hairpin-helix domain-containing protein [Holophagales bacterium]|nr:helix-hairpin-helix domain-containing protein [Holophagales bacterium]
MTHFEHNDRPSTHRAIARRAVAHLVLFFALALSAAPLWAESPSVPGVVNVNEADAAQLAQLPRIGPALAQRIIEFRDENGKFERAQDLILVRGIGEKTFEMLEPFVVVEGKTTLERKLRGSDVEAARAQKPGDSSES